MPPRASIWLAMVAVHLAAGAWGWFAGSDRLAAIVAASIYIPLWPFDKLGVPVFPQSGWFFPPPTYLGWAIIVALWLITYWYLAAMIARFLAKHERAA